MNFIRLEELQRKIDKLKPVILRLYREERPVMECMRILEQSQGLELDLEADAKEGSTVLEAIRNVVWKDDYEKNGQYGMSFFFKVLDDQKLNLESRKRWLKNIEQAVPTWLISWFPHYYQDVITRLRS